MLSVPCGLSYLSQAHHFSFLIPQKLLLLHLQIQTQQFFSNSQRSPPTTKARKKKEKKEKKKGES